MRSLHRGLLIEPSHADLEKPVSVQTEAQVCTIVPVKTEFTSKLAETRAAAGS